MNGFDHRPRKLRDQRALLLNVRLPGQHSVPQQLCLGHGDGGVSDNQGFFAIQLFAVEPRRKSYHN
jgi:hypothetical protein